MAYPTLEEYAIALQSPRTAFSDPELQKGSIPSTGLGLPVVFSGGFALTYPVTVVTGKKYAARCFHRESKALERRYQAISARLQTLHSSYFLDFTFQPQGVRAGGKTAPLVKMAWASGETLGVFLGKNYRNKGALHNLNASLRKLSTFLENNRIAHGDIQLGNLMVTDAGRTIQLIDYDGMYVEALQSLGNSEFGVAHFQHPQRRNSWNARLDRFSFIVLYIALKALETYPELWEQTHSGESSAVLTANDFAFPDTSPVLQKLLASQQLSTYTRHFVKICQSPFDAIPTLDAFITDRQVSAPVITGQPQKTKRYIGAYPVLDATKYALCQKHVGRQVELIGKIVEVKKGWTRTRRKAPYIFVNFGSWKGESTKLCIWAEGIKTFSTPPDATWVGKWVTSTGLLESYHDQQLRYAHLSIAILHANQVHILQESEAMYRLGADSQGADISYFTQLRGIAERGDVEAQFQLGWMYANGTGVSKDNAQAVHWYRKASEQGFPAAQYNLGKMHEQGLGISKNYSSAVGWYRKAATQGFAEAQYALGLMYENGLGVLKSNTLAANWYHQAAGQGFVLAQDKLREMLAKASGMPKNSTAVQRSQRTPPPPPPPSPKSTSRIARPPKAVSSNSEELFSSLLLLGALLLIAGIAFFSFLSRPAPKRHSLPPQNTTVMKSPAPASVQNSSRSMSIAEIQKILTKLRYSPGPINGHQGERTRQAIADFQRNIGKKPTTEITAELIELLAHANAVTLDSSNDHVPEACFDNSSYRDEVCELSKSSQVPYRITKIAVWLVAIDYAADICKFSLSNNYNAVKSSILYIKGVGGLFAFLRNNYQENKIETISPWSSKENFCTDFLHNYGPEAPHGPNGEDNRFFIK